MKDQYFGDINDYRKYGLLRAILRAGRFRILVAWMLTRDDGSADGKRISYLEDPKRGSRHDPVLYRGLKDLLARGLGRRVSLIEESDLLPGARFFSDVVPDASVSRSTWFDSLAARAKESDLVFLDPDNGLEVKSKPFGRPGSSKYLYWREVESLAAMGKSLLIYQHFIREDHVHFAQRMMDALRVAAPGCGVEAFSTSHVLFLMALQSQHHPAHEAIVRLVEENWEGQLIPWKEMERR